MTWQRLEGSAVGPDLREGQEARIADPLWMLARQWQMGELTGDDAGSPIIAEATVISTPIARVQLGPSEAPGPAVARQALGIPLEAAVERETVWNGTSGVRLAAEAGLQLFRLLDRGGLPRRIRADLRAAYPLTLPVDDGLDPVGRTELELFARRSFDARTLRAAAAAGDPSIPALASGAARRFLDTWLAWCGARYSEPPDGPVAWDVSRLEHRFRVSARPDTGPEMVLEAAAYEGGHLDWYAFDLSADSESLGAPEATARRTLRTVPTPARFVGQAAARFWQLEDGTVWFGDLAAAPEDLARLAVAAFGTTFGSDWFLIPCHFPVGSLARVETLRVLDSFGVSHRIRSCAENDGPDRTWRGFELSGDPSSDAPALDQRSSPWLLFAPALPGPLESQPIEEVALRRDETANLGWAAELRVESAAGRVVDRAARARAEASPAPAPLADAWRYQLASPVPGYQVPLVPVQSSDGALYLQRGRLATSGANGSVATRGAVGRILEPDQALLLRDEAVPASGVRVTRTWQLARTGDGRAVLWVGRRTGPARPLPTPGLVFDQVDDREPKPTVPRSSARTRVGSSRRSV
jgi:hypothetical protein